MDESILQFLLGGVLLILAVWWKIRDIRRGVVLVLSRKPVAGGTRGRDARVRAWLHVACQLLLGITAFSVLVDPLIPGTAVVEIHAPRSFPTTLDNLSVRTVPIGFRGAAGG